MKKNKVLAVVIACVAVIITALVITMAATGKFASLKKHFSDETTTSAPADETTAVQANARPKTAKPAQLVAALIEDCGEGTSQSLSKLDGYGFNTAIFDLKGDNSAAVMALISEAQAAGIYSGVRADISGGDTVTAFLEEVNADFVILSGADETLGDYVSKVTAVCEKITAIDSAAEIGVEPVYCSNISAGLDELISGGSIDFVFVVQSGNDDSAFSIFENAQTIWNEKAISVWMCHCLKGLDSFSTEKAKKTVSSVSRSADMSMCGALAFYPLSDIESAKSTAAEVVLNYIKTRDTYLLDKEFSVSNHSKTSFTTEQSTVTFRGTSSPAYDLKCNGEKLTVAKTGDFSVDCPLKVGKNTIKFEHKGKTYTYTVTYKIKLLKSVSPSDDITVPGGMLVEVSAIAHKSASLSVEFGGKSYTMKAVQTESEEDSAPDADSDFTSFTASLKTPEGTSSVQKLGKYKVTAKYQGLTESLSGANVIVSANVIEVPPETDPTYSRADLRGHNSRGRNLIPRR